MNHKLVRGILIFTWPLFLLTTAFIGRNLSGNSSQKKQLQFIDHRYEANIKSDFLYPNRGFTQDIVQSSVIALNGQTQLILEFDELYADYQDYSARIIHCNQDWTRSRLMDMEYTFEFNEFPIRDFEYSNGTRIPYTHYTFEVPRVKLSGNYLLVINREPDSDDIVLTRRFVVFDSKVQVLPRIAVRTGAFGQFQKHQIEFDINHRGIRLNNPYNDVKVVIRQNQRWDNAINDLKPTQVRQDRSMLQYQHFTGENTILALNEFRFIDLRSTSFKGQKVARIEKDENHIEIHGQIDRNRSGNPYSQYSDLNGGYVIENNDPGADFLEEDYIETTLYLETPQTFQKIYAVGSFNHWRQESENLLQFDNDLQLYKTTLLLKQGFYNYQYYVENGEPNAYQLEGAFFEAENEYDILVYFRAPGSFQDEVVGYRSFNSRN